jgi:hypothetical protein
MASASDFRINADIRRVLTKHWINLRKLQYSCIGGIVYLRGVVEVMYSAGDGGDSWQGVTAKQVSELEKAIRRIPNVKRVQFKFQNWERGTDGWQRKANE